MEQAIVDVWFESGCSWLAVAEERAELGDVDLYLEGSDQHRGWFHSSLLVALGVANKAPYKTVLTHGFVLDSSGKPYSKSTIEKARREGKKIKYIDPDEVMAKNGAEVFRLWAASTEFRTDIAYSEEILKGLTDWYRKFRNTSRYMLGNLSDFDPNSHNLDNVELSELDRLALGRLSDLTARVTQAYESYSFHVVYRSLVDYVAVDLSALYLDVVKDRLYSDHASSAGRRAVQAVLFEITSTLAKLAAPVLCFTAEDVWKHLPNFDGKAKSVHMTDLPTGSLLAEDDPSVKTWNTLRKYRDLCGKALEEFRAQKNRSEDACLTIHAPEADRKILEASLETFANLTIVSKVVLGSGTDGGIDVSAAPGSRCERCWRWYEEMSESADDLCIRCCAAIA